MQLINQQDSAGKTKSKSKINLAEKLALAATALVGGVAHAQETETDSEWDFAISVLAYTEIDRVSAAEVSINADKDYGDSGHVTYKFLIDSLSGPSANGAIAQPTPQTFTQPSGKEHFVIDANEIPLDDVFKDTRVQFNVNWTDALFKDVQYTVGSNLSKEYDYQSASVNGELAFDFNQKNTTLAVGLSYGMDKYDPQGGIPIAFTSMVINRGQFANGSEFQAAYDATRGGTSETIDTVEALIGVTQVINRRMLVQFNYGYSDRSGYLTDPYKILSVVDNNGVTQDLVYENRPDSRSQHTFFGLMKYHFEESIFDISYRYFTDDWDINSHTVDMHWRFLTENESFWEPHIRLYQQSAAKFYQPFLAQSEPQPGFASADYRVGDLDTFTIGLKYGFRLDSGDRAEIRLEYYRQTPNKANQPQGIANLDGLDIYPSIDAAYLQFNYYF